MSEWRGFDVCTRTEVAHEAVLKAVGNSDGLALLEVVRDEVPFRADARDEVGLELVEDAPMTLYRNTTTSMSIQRPSSTTTISAIQPTDAFTTTSSYSTTRITQTEVYAPRSAGGWIGTGENRVWVPADS